MKKYERKRLLSAIEYSRMQPPRATLAVAEPRALSEQVAVVGGGTLIDGETRLKRLLLEGNGSSAELAYDKTVSPASATVEVGMNLYHVYGLTMDRAALSLHVWLRMRWKDERLAWDPAEYGGVESITFTANAASVEESLIWVPEVELYEAAAVTESSVGTTYDLPRKDVIVASDGTCFWSRPGRITSLCELDGLADFPYDRVTCSLRFGGWSRGGSTQNVTSYSEGALDSLLQTSATFQEYRVLGAQVQTGSDAFSCCPDPHGFPYVDFRIVIGRAAKHYVVKIIMTNIVLTYLSFGVFFLDPKTGERLQTSFTILLTIVAADTLVTGVVPTCNPVLWIEYFYLVCWGFVVIAIIGNGITHYLHYMNPPEVYISSMPRLAHFFEKLRQPRRRHMLASVTDMSSPNLSATARSERVGGWQGDGDGRARAGRAMMMTGGSGRMEPRAASLAELQRRRSDRDGRRTEVDNSIGDMLEKRRKLSRQPTMGSTVLEPNLFGRRHMSSVMSVRGGASAQVAPAPPASQPSPQPREVNRCSAASVTARSLSAASVTAPDPIVPPSPGGGVADDAPSGATSGPEVGVDESSGVGERSGGGGGAPKMTRYASKEPDLNTHQEGSLREERGSGGDVGRPELADATTSSSRTVVSFQLAAGADAAPAAASATKTATEAAGAEPKATGAEPSSPLGTSYRKRVRRQSQLIYKRLASTVRYASLRPPTARNFGAILPFAGSDAQDGAFVGAEDLAETVTATELDPVQAALVRKAFRLLDSMSARLGVLGPKQLEYFAHHMGKLPKELASQHDENHDGVWSIEEFSTLCVSLIRLHGDEKFKVLVEGLLESYAHKTKLFQVYWEGWGLWWDWVCIVFLFPTYTIALLILFFAANNLDAGSFSHQVA